MRINTIIAEYLQKFRRGVRFNGKLTLVLNTYGSRDSVVATATRNRLDGPGIESLWGRDFPHLSSSALEPTQSPIQWVPGLSRG